MRQIVTGVLSKVGLIIVFLAKMPNGYQDKLIEFPLNFLLEIGEHFSSKAIPMRKSATEKEQI